MHPIQNNKTKNKEDYIVNGCCYLKLTNIDKTLSMWYYNIDKKITKRRFNNVQRMAKGMGRLYRGQMESYFCKRQRFYQEELHSL